MEDLDTIMADAEKQSQLSIKNFRKNKPENEDNVQ